MWLSPQTERRCGPTGLLEVRVVAGMALTQSQLLKAGAIILGKATLSVSFSGIICEIVRDYALAYVGVGVELLEVLKAWSTRDTRHTMLSFLRINQIPAGWSPVGGQGQNAYVRGGRQPGDPISSFNVRENLMAAF